MDTIGLASQKERAAIVTGTGGLGFEDALALAWAGAEVIIAGRNPGKGAEAVKRIRAEASSAVICFPSPTDAPAPDAAAHNLAHPLARPERLRR